MKDPKGPFTEAEREILRECAGTMKCCDIAAKLGRAPSTINYQLRQLLIKEPEIKVFGIDRDKRVEAAIVRLRQQADRGEPLKTILIPNVDLR